MDLENLLPLVLAAIYILSRVFKAKPKKDAPGRPARPRQTPASDVVEHKTAEQRKPFSFEDLLKEFEKNLAGEEYVEEKPMPVEAIEYKKSEPVIPEPERSPYFSYEGLTYETMAEKEDSSGSDEISENYKQVVKEENEFVKMFREPNGARNAFVMSEIFNRKYF